MVGSQQRRIEAGGLKDKREKLREKSIRGFETSSKWKYSWPQKGLWNFVREKVLQDMGELLEEEGDVIREYKAMHEEIFLSCWLREDGNEKGRTNNGNRQGDQRGDGQKEEERRGVRRERDGEC